MSRVLRITLMWLVALALPVQGVAAATMVFCAPTHRGAAHEHAAHDHADHAAPGHHPSHDAGAPDAGVDATASDLDTVSCSVCASCCTPAALPSALIEADPPHGHAVYQTIVASSVSAVLTGGLDRPPRLFLA